MYRYSMNKQFTQEEVCILLDGVRFFIKDTEDRMSDSYVYDPVLFPEGAEERKKELERHRELAKSLREKLWEMYD